MIRFLLFVAAVAIALGVLTGVINIGFDSEKISEAPSNLIGLLGEKEVTEKIRAWPIKTKRAIEQRLIDDDERRLELALLYAKKDAERLQELLDEEADNPTRFIPQAELLAKSLKYIDDNADDADESILSSLKNDFEVTFDIARDVLSQLSTIEVEDKDTAKRLADVRDDLGDYFGQVAGTQDSAKEKDGSSHEAPEERSGEPSPIPLKF